MARSWRIASLGNSDLAPVRAGQELPWANLAAYLREHLDDAEGPMEVLQFPNGNANLTYLVSFGATPYVVRRPPFGTVAPGAHDMGREPRCLPSCGEPFTQRLGVSSSVTITLLSDPISWSSSIGKVK